MNGQKSGAATSQKKADERPIIIDFMTRMRQTRDGEVIDRRTAAQCWRDRRPPNPFVL